MWQRTLQQEKCPGVKVQSQIQQKQLDPVYYFVGEWLRVSAEAELITASMEAKSSTGAVVGEVSKQKVLPQVGLTGIAGRAL